MGISTDGFLSFRSSVLFSPLGEEASNSRLGRPIMDPFLLFRSCVLKIFVPILCQTTVNQNTFSQVFQIFSHHSSHLHTINMRFSTITALALTSVLGASAMPTMTKRQAMDIDPIILQFALTVSGPSRTH
jgi:hypothetical protein